MRPYRRLTSIERKFSQFPTKNKVVSLSLQILCYAFLFVLKRETRNNFGEMNQNE